MTPTERYEYIAQHWETKSLDDLATAMGVTRKSVTDIAVRLRPRGYNLPYKPANGGRRGVLPQEGQKRVRTFNGYTREQEWNGEKWVTISPRKERPSKYQIGDKMERLMDGKMKMSVLTKNGWRVANPKQTYIPEGTIEVRGYGGEMRKCVREGGRWVPVDKRGGGRPRKHVENQTRPLLSRKRAPKPEIKRLETLCRAGQVRVPIEVPRLKIHVQCRPENVEAKVKEFKERGYDVKVLPPVTLAA